MESGFPLRFVLNVFLMNFCLSLVSPLYFHVSEREQKCFIKDIPAETVVIGDYWTQLYDQKRLKYLPASQYIKMSVAARTPNDEVILSHNEGNFNFTSFRSGEHKICLQPNSPQPLAAGLIMVVHLDIRSGQRTNDYKEIQRRDRLTDLQLRVRQLTDQIQQIQKEIIYQKSRGEDLLTTHHNLDRWIYWWPIIRFVFVVAFIVSVTECFYDQGYCSERHQ